MTENGKKFLEKASKDEALQAELQAEMKKAQTEAIMKVAAAHGVTLTAEDLKADEKMTALSEDELKAVAGGGACACPVAGAGAGDGLACGCVIAGAGKDSSSRYDQCYCAIGGSGRN